MEGIEPSPHGVRIRHAANKHLKLPIRIKTAELGCPKLAWGPRLGYAPCRGARSKWARSESNALVNDPAFTAQVAFRGRTPSPEISHSDELSKSAPQRAHVSVPRRGAVSAATSRTRRARSTSVPGAGFEPAFLSSELSVLPTRRSRNTPNAAKATESAPGGLRWHTWSHSMLREARTDDATLCKP